MRFLIASLLLGAGLAAHAGPPAIYDEGADAKAAIRATLAEAAQARLPVLVVFGANWCGDCRMLDNSFKHGASAPLIAKSFKVVKVDVGRFDRNVDIAEAYRVPLKKGIPAVAVLSPEGRLIYATEGGELADARRMGDQGVYDFFARITADAR
ncbi:thioredoxin family protein [Pelomonas aquatica]|jgi:thioredoxin 1|uniref:Thioredoxin family protein n=1 Tax=Pelomonas aquatica TaxID=431058 RepID=A0A9X4LD66_9BURK|nr:thioredoxin family protein [Pelomonas aquatica]MCY4755398.1 thioredoxin family protein [Pelomonas aquatica]MDG0861736.1 thioredoxin family protein [Pelomonas aquatica]